MPTGDIAWSASPSERINAAHGHTAILLARRTSLQSSSYTSVVVAEAAMRWSSPRSNSFISPFKNLIRVCH